jgi:hypothetical protein
MAARLKPLLPEIVFVGGCTTGPLISDPAASPVRATDDVDVILKVASYAEYARLSNRLPTLAFLRLRRTETECSWESLPGLAFAVLLRLRVLAQLDGLR